MLSRRELEDAERAYWIQATSIGFIFTMGVIVALVVALVLLPKNKPEPIDDYGEPADESAEAELPPQLVMH